MAVRKNDAKNKDVPTKKSKVARKKVKKKPPKKTTPEKKTATDKKKSKRKDIAIQTLVRKPTELQKQELEKVLGILGDAFVRQTLIEVGGENALAIVRNFYGDSSDEELAKKLKIKISDVRATLNRLHNEGLVNYIRQKDSETGWYSYSWSLNHERMEKWATIQASRLDMVGGNGGEYYFCAACGAATITNFETAASGDFRCERCNKLLEFLDEKRIAELNEKRGF